MKHEIAGSIGNDAQSTDCLKSVLYELDAFSELSNKIISILY